MKYRKIWKDHYGQIPIDELGRTYDIHHIDGNRENNDISNLKAVSLQKHYEIHRSQEDWGACWYISNRLKLDKIELEYLKKKMREDNPMFKEENKLKCRKPRYEGFGKKVSKGKKGKSIATKGIKKGPQNSIECPYCNKIGGISNMKRYHFENCKIVVGLEKHKRINKSKDLQCPYCGLIGKGGGGAMKQWHFENCKKNNNDR